MSSFLNFPAFKKSDEISVFGKNERMSTLPVNLIGTCETNNFFPNKNEYPHIDVQRDLYQNRLQSDISVLLPVNQGLLKHICSTYFEEGFKSALREASNASERFPTLASIAWGCLKLLDVGSEIKKVFSPTLEPGIDHLFSQTRNWKRSPVRCFAWHPHLFKIAVAASDDSIKIYYKSTIVMEPPVLKRKEQKGILCMAWRPWASADLAVGTQKGLILWNIDQMLASMTSKSQSFLLENPLPVTSLSWNPAGTLLATASVSSPDILLWDVDHQTCTPLKRVGMPASLVSWSPNGAYLCASTTSKIFRLWKIDNLSMSRWSIERGTVQSIAWTPCNNFMLFVTSEEPFLYCVGFVEEHLFAHNSPPPKQAIPIAELTKTNLGDLEVGGQPQSIILNAKGSLLAISFKETNLVAIFSVSLSKFVLNVTPFGLINGLGLEYPTVIAFENTTERDILTICWSSGRVQYFPFM